MKRLLLTCCILTGLIINGQSQNCNPQGNQNTYGANNVWIGYVYNNSNLSSYKGYINRGTAASPNFDTDFGGAATTLATAGCPVETETFSVRFRLNKTFSNGTYKITVGGDDGYRLSLNGGNSWVINAWNDHAYQTTELTTTLNGTCNIVLEYYDNTGDNRLSFHIGAVTCGNQNTETYGLNNIWNGYLYTGTSFNSYAGKVTTGNPVDASFTESFGGSDTYFHSSCNYLRTEKFSARYRLIKTFADGIYSFGVGGDDGYRLSIDSGRTWLINRWDDHSFITTTATLRLNGTYKLVLEYYENGGDNLLNFFVQSGTVLATEKLQLTGREQQGTATLAWDLQTDNKPAFFELEKSTNGSNFSKASTINAAASTLHYSTTDKMVSAGNMYYRIKMTATDGSSTWSNTITLHNSAENTGAVKIYPTVLTGAGLHIISNNALSDASIIIHDFTGKPVYNQRLGKTAAGLPVTVNTGNTRLPAGIYLLSVMEAGRVMRTQKITVL